MPFKNRTISTACNAGSYVRLIHYKWVNVRGETIFCHALHTGWLYCPAIIDRKFLCSYKFLFSINLPFCGKILLTGQIILWLIEADRTWLSSTVTVFLFFYFINHRWISSLDHNNGNSLTFGVCNRLLTSWPVQVHVCAVDARAAVVGVELVAGARPPPALPDLHLVAAAGCRTGSGKQTVQRPITRRAS